MGPLGANVIYNDWKSVSNLKKIEWILILKVVDYMIKGNIYDSNQVRGELRSFLDGFSYCLSSI